MEPALRLRLRRKGNLTSRTVTAPDTESTWSYTYNSAGQVLTAADPRGYVTTYAYDAKGDLIRITNALGQVRVVASYDANGRPLSMPDPNGLVTTLAYNCRGEVTSSVATNGSRPMRMTPSVSYQVRVRITRPRFHL